MTETVLLSVRETARRLNCSACTVRRRIADGTIPAVRVGRLVRVAPRALDRLLGADQSEGRDAR